MNIENLIFQAGHAIEEYARCYDDTCYLAFVDELVVALPLNKALTKIALPLIISPYQQKDGCTPAKWNSIGTALHNLYCKELACQTRQKH